MRPVILYIATSLDGFIARTDGSVDWLFHDADYGMSAFYKSIDTVIIGRKTYEVMRKLGTSGYVGKKNYVFTSQAPAKRESEIEYVTTNAVPFVETLRAGSGRAIWLVGGAALAKSLLDAGLVDEMTLSIHPIVLGNGIPLFAGHPRPLELSLRECLSYESGLVQPRYGVKGSKQA